MGEGDDGIFLLYSDHQKTFTLKEFEEMQSRQAQEAKEKLAALRVKVLKIVREACEVGDQFSFLRHCCLVMRGCLLPFLYET